MVTFATENALALKFTVSWPWDAKFCIVTEEFDTVFLLREFSLVC